MDLNWKDLTSYRRVPARRIGLAHFAPLAARHQESFGHFQQLYTDEIRADLEGIRATMKYVLDLAQKEDSPGMHTSRSSEIQMGLNHVINRLRDLSNPARLAWDGLIWELQEEQQNRLELVRVDVARHGSLLFYLGHLGRWLRWFLGHSATAARAAATRLWPLLWRRIVAVHNFFYGRLKPLLRWIGLVRPPTIELMQALDEARLDSVLKRGLPEDYLAHFTFTPLTDEALFVGFEEELAVIDQAVERWEDGLTTSFIVHGQRGGGKTSLINITRKRFFKEDQPVTHATVDRKMTTASELIAYLSELMQLADVDSLETLAEALLNGPRRAVLLEGCHNLYLRRIGGLEAMHHLLWLIARTNHHVLWGICMGQYANSYLDKNFPLGRLFHFEIGIPLWQPEELRRLIMARHNQSGYSLRYVYDKSLEKALHRRVKRWRRPDEPAVQEALEQIFFERLAEICRQNIMVALFYWLRSLRPVGADRFDVMPLEELTLDLIRSFSLNQAFILNAILQHDNLTADELAQILDDGLIQTRLELEILVNQSVLDMDDETLRFRVNHVVLKPVVEMLKGRNILY